MEISDPPHVACDGDIPIDFTRTQSECARLFLASMDTSIDILDGAVQAS